jgi:hypothetical protein
LVWIYNQLDEGFASGMAMSVDVTLIAITPQRAYNEKTSSEPVFAGASIRRRIEVLAHGFGPVEVAAQIRVDLER